MRFLRGVRSENGAVSFSVRAVSVYRLVFGSFQTEKYQSANFFFFLVLHWLYQANIWCKIFTLTRISCNTDFPNVCFFDYSRLKIGIIRRLVRFWQFCNGKIATRA